MKIGFIANPESGKDIRRIVSDAFTFNNFEKLNIIKRIVRIALSNESTEFVFMPELFGFGQYTKEEFGNRIKVLDFSPSGESDTERAAALMAESGVCCIVTLGGDGTNRLVAKKAGSVPLIPVATGTNNAFPFTTDGSAVGMVLYAISKIGIKPSELKRQKRIEIFRGDELIDIALVDVAVTAEEFVGSKAIFDVDKLRELFVTFSRWDKTGLSSIFAFSMPVGRDVPIGGHCVFDGNGRAVSAPILPGRLVQLRVRSLEKIPVDTPYRIKYVPSIIAADGERIVKVDGDNFSVRVTQNGPYVISAESVLERACKEKVFLV